MKLPPNVRAPKTIALILALILASLTGKDIFTVLTETLNSASVSLLPKQ